MKHTKKYIPYIIILGVIIIPLLYSYFYLGAFWDPYSKLDEVPVAIVNEDQGAVIHDTSRNLGNELCERLKDDGSLAFTFTDANTAKEGLEATSYYAVITIPADFSTRIASSSTTEKQVATITYRSNEKRNYLAAQILKSAVTTVEESLRSSINEEIVTTLTDALIEIPEQLATLSDGLSQLQTGASKLSDGSNQLLDGSKALSEGSNTLASGMSELANGATTLANGTSSLESGSKQLIVGSSALYEGLTTFDHKLNEYTKGVASAHTGISTIEKNFGSLQAGMDQLLSGARALQLATGDATALKQGTSSLATGASSLQQGLERYTGGVDSLLQTITQLTQALSTYAQQTKDPTITALVTQLASKENQTQLQTLQAASKTLNDACTQLKEGTATLASGTQNIDALQAGMSKLVSGLESAKSGTNALADGVSKLSVGLSTLTNANDALTAGSNQLASGALELNKGMKSLSNGVLQVNDGAASLATGAQSAFDGAVALQDGMTTWSTGATAVEDGLSKLVDGINQAKTGVDDSIENTNNQLEALNGLPAYAATPVTIESNPYAPVPNYGTAFAPYFMSLSLWVGGLMIFFGIYFDPDCHFKLLSRASDQIVKRSLAYLVIGLTQAILLCIILFTGLHLTVQNCLLFYVSCCLISMTFIAMIQCFLVCFSNVGKFLAIALLILQLTSCGGTFPMETVPTIYQWLYPFMPMTYSVGLLKEAISGTNDATLIRNNVVILLVFLLVSFGFTVLYSRRHKKQ